MATFTSGGANVYHIEKAKNKDAGPPFNKPLPIWT